MTCTSCRAQPAEQLVKHLLLAVRGDPVGVEHPLGAEPVDQDEQLVGGQIDVRAVAELAALLRLDEMPAQPVGEAVELGVLELAQRRIAQRPAPEADLDLGLEVPLISGISVPQRLRRASGSSRAARQLQRTPA